MSEKDLDIAIEKCKRIMEFDTRTLENPESENGHIFEKVYDLLQFLSQFQFATETNVATTDVISRQAAIDALGEEPLVWDDGEYELAERNQWRRDVAAIKGLPSAQTELENKIRAIGYTGKEGRIYIGGRLFAVRELPQ